jgi:hypothetical protein
VRQSRHQKALTVTMATKTIRRGRRIQALCEQRRP